jgi:RNA recognition motif-containing protein
MYDRSIGCQVRTAREIKKDEVALSVPYSAMITPDLIACSDAGQAVFECCNKLNHSNFWDAFGLTHKLEKQQFEKIQQNSGTQLLVKILQERKKLESKLNSATKSAEQNGIDMPPNNLAHLGVLSQRVPFLAFLIHQRFANELNPPVSSSSEILQSGTPQTFAPYARTLPSSVCVPICWKRNELALLAGCIPGMPALQKVAARTMQLSMELVALLDAGILHRFPSTFSPGMITWDRWVWAAAVYESRVVSASALPTWVASNRLSPINVWESCGVIIPFLDMLNHYDTANVQWDMSSEKGQATKNTDDDLTNSDDDSPPMDYLNLITQERLKKHVQIYRDYGSFNNEYLMMQYGFARMSNPFDRVTIAWALVDGVGGVAPPAGYDFSSDIQGISLSQLVFESSDADAVKSWWTEQRIALLGKATMNNEDASHLLKKGKKIKFCASNDGRIDTMLISVAIAATLSPGHVSKWFLQSPSGRGPALDGLVLDSHSLHCARIYLRFLFTRKLEKLLNNLDTCIKDHFNSVRIWTKASSGGLNYVGMNDGVVSPAEVESSSVLVGWQSFFDAYAYNSTMEIEERYFAMAPDSCVLTLYDGHVRSLQSSLDIMETGDTFINNVRRQLEELGCVVDTESKEISTDPPVSLKVEPASHVETKVTEMEKPNSSAAKKERNGSDSRRDNERRQGKKGDRPPAIKLHIGNLSYQTLPNQLYDFFTRLYGKDSVLECHIPTERETGNSRGFGFVTMPAQHARAALESGRSHEMDGRILKVAESNSAGSAKGGGRGSRAPPMLSSDRCAHCGYRPRWCTCKMGMPPPNMGMPPPDSFYGPGPFIPPMPPPGMHPYDMDDRRRREGYGWGPGGDGWGNRRSYSRSPSHHRRGRERGYRSRSRSRSYERRKNRIQRSRSRSRSRSRERRVSNLCVLISPFLSEID